MKIESRVEFKDTLLRAAADRGQARAAKRYLAIVRQDSRRAIKVKAATTRDLKTAKSGSRAELRRRARLRIAAKQRMTSKPGQPPFAHIRGRLGLKLISFAYDPVRKVGLVGYVKYNAAKSRAAIPALEYGGSVTIRVAAGGRQQLRRVRIAARPNIIPTALRLLPRLREFMRDTIK